MSRRTIAASDNADVLGAGAEIRYLRGWVRFLTGGPYRASGFFASVIVVWRPRRVDTCDECASVNVGPCPHAAAQPTRKEGGRADA